LRSYTDTRGLPLSTGNEDAATHFNAAIDDYFQYRVSAGKHAKAAIEADPGFALGHCLRGYLFMLFGSTAFHPHAQGALDLARKHEGGVTPREAMHIAALAAWLGGEMDKTCALWDQILLEHPRDLLTLRLQHFALFWMGRSADLRGGPARVLHAWDEKVPGYGNVLGMLSFGHEECGAYPEAEAAGRQAMELDREDLWALHAVAHVLEMQGRLKEGLAWLDFPANAWDDRNPFRGHLWWHRALFLYEGGDYEAVLALYDRSIASEKSDFYLDIQNAAALLARLEFAGVNVGDRWGHLAEHVEGRLDDHVLAFTDTHAMMALAATGRSDAAMRLLASLEAFSGTTGNSCAAVMRPVAIPVSEAILAYARGDYGRCADILLPLRPNFIRVGASHAQRDIFHQFLIEASIRAGRWTWARALLSERTALKPNSTVTWHKYAEVLSALGDTDGAAQAGSRALDLRIG
jgi:tetratricopeptide (TPR) repeat protein